VRIVLYFAAILFAAILMAGCKKDVAVVPTAAHQSIKITTVDSTSLNGGDKGNPIKPPQQ
jgi:hypothetical protein